MKKYFMIPFLVVMIFTACQQKKEENTETIPKTEINPLSGSWKMQEIQYIYADTTYIGKPITYGTFLFTTKRYSLLYNPWTSERKAFKELSKPTDEEIIGAFKSIVFNSGGYTYTDSTVTTTADMAKVPGFEGGNQFYTYQIDGSKLDIMMFDETYPNGDKPEWFGKLKILFKLIKE